jgi:hypothetical protein
MVCYLDRVGFPLAYTVMAHAAGVDKKTQGMIYSAYYNGYTFTQVYPYVYHALYFYKGAEIACNCNNISHVDSYC